MAKWKIYTPEGVQDILFDECYAKREIEDRIRKLFRSWGYFEVETPTLEFYDSFFLDTGLTPQETMFKFTDQQGRILVLRPEITIPIARIAATKFRDSQYPVRFSYIGNAFKYNELGGGKQKEFTQAGVEIVGVNTPEADAEVIATAITAIKAAGVEEFQIDLGQVEFFKGIMEETGFPQEDIEQVRVLIDRKDFLAVEEIVGERDIPKRLKDLILDLPGLFGSVDVIDRVEKATANRRSLNALANLRQVLEILEDYSLSGYVSVDLGMVQSLNYYTGIIFRGFTYDVGFPILSGGRYDNLVENFGLKCSATGFSLGINMLMTALDRQKAETRKPGIDTLVCYERPGRKTALYICEALRSQGTSVELDLNNLTLGTAPAYAREKNIGGIIYVENSDSLKIIDMETGAATDVTLEELMSK